MNTRMLAGAIAVFGFVVAVPTLAASPTAPNAGFAEPAATSAANKAIPLVNWAVDSGAGIKQINAGRVMPKAATDLVTIFRPITPCRLVDTRGNGAPIQGGAFAPNTRRTMNTNGNCGIPTSNVAGISLTLVTFNLTPATGGFISVLAPAAPITGTNDIFNFGAQWSGTSVNTRTNNAGSFDVYVAQATADVIIDVNGYYQDMNNLDTNTELDISGTTVGDLLQVSNSNALGSSLAALTAAPGAALRVYGGGLQVVGAGINSGSFVFVHQVDTSNNFGTGTGTLCATAYSIIDNAYSNNDPNAILIVTPIEYYGGTSATGPNHPAAAIYRPFYIFAGCGVGDNRWAIHLTSGAATFNNLNKFSVMVVKP